MKQTLSSLIKSTFPAGTLSGAPKVRAMEIIDEMEQDPGDHMVVAWDMSHFQGIWILPSQSEPHA